MKQNEYLKNTNNLWGKKQSNVPIKDFAIIQKSKIVTIMTTNTIEDIYREKGCHTLDKWKKTRIRCNLLLQPTLGGDEIDCYYFVLIKRIFILEEKKGYLQT